MFVADGKVVIYSQVNGASIFTAAGVTPKAAVHRVRLRFRPRGRQRLRAACSRPDAAGTQGPYIPLTEGHRHDPERHDADTHARGLLRGQLPRRAARRPARPHRASRATSTARASSTSVYELYQPQAAIVHEHQDMPSIGADRSTTTNPYPKSGHAR